MFFMFFIRLLLANTWKKSGARLREKENLFRYRAKFEGNLLTFFTCTSPCARAYDANIVRSRDGQYMNYLKGILSVQKVKGPYGKRKIRRMVKERFGKSIKDA